MRRWYRLKSGCDLLHSVAKLLPGLGRFLSDTALTEPGSEIAALGFRHRTELIPQFLGSPPSDTGQESRNALECDFVVRVNGKLHECSNILDVRLFEKSEAAGDREGYTGPSQGQLHLQRLEMRAVENRHGIQIDAFIPQI